MPTIVATPKAANANSYVTLAAATTYLTDARLWTSTWIAATTAIKETALIWATMLIDVSFDFPGYITDQDQALRWPRSGVVDADGRFVDYDTIPSLIVKATCELAAELVKSDRLSTQDILGLGISELKAGPVELKIDPKLILPFIPAHIISMLATIAELKSSAQQGSRVVKLIRT